MHAKATLPEEFNMKWSPEKFKREMARKNLTYEELASRLALHGWISIPEFVVLQLQSYANGISPARLQDCWEIAQAMGVRLHALLEDEHSPFYEAGFELSAASG